MFSMKVLMQTRSEKVRARILGLRIVKYLLEHLREEYLVFLAETIPFLGELLEDVEPSVKSLAQEILKEMESMSGESLRQYLWWHIRPSHFEFWWMTVLPFKFF